VLAEEPLAEVERPVREQPAVAVAAWALRRSEATTQSAVVRRRERSGAAPRLVRSVAERRRQIVQRRPGRPRLPASAATSAASPPTAGGVIGGPTGVGNPDSGTAPAASPPITGQSSPVAAPVTVQGVAEQPVSSSTGLAKPSADGTSTKIVPARPCSTAARETDGTTTCVGIPHR
jgi:hypothetical protein